MSQNIKIWNNIYDNNLSNLNFPNEMFVRMFHKYILTLEKKTEKLKVLDFGFGTGANSIYMLDNQIDVYGVEVSSKALELTQCKISDDNKKLNFKLFDGKNLPFEDESFDVVVAWQVLYYNDLDSFNEILTEINRVLRKGGIFIGTMCAINDISHVQSEQIAPLLYRSKVKHQENAICIILDKANVEELFPNKGLIIGEMMFELDGIVGRHWVIKYEN